MNDNLPESERWVPVKAEQLFAESAKNGAAEQNAKSAYCSPAFERARREAEAMIADRFKRIS